MECSRAEWNSGLLLPRGAKGWLSMGSVPNFFSEAIGMNPEAHVKVDDESLLI